MARPYRGIGAAIRGMAGCWPVRWVGRRDRVRLPGLARAALSPALRESVPGLSLGCFSSSFVVAPPPLPERRVCVALAIR